MALSGGGHGDRGSDFPSIRAYYLSKRIVVALFTVDRAPEVPSHTSSPARDRTPPSASATHDHVWVCGRGQVGLARLRRSPKAAGLLLPPFGSLILEPDLRWRRERMEMSKRDFLHLVPPSKMHNDGAIQGTNPLQ